MEMEASQPNFNAFSSLELYYHLIDLYIIPFEDEYEQWRHLREQMLQMCNDSYNRQNL